MKPLSGPICKKCGKQHRGYSSLEYLECSGCCKEVGSSKLHYPGALCDDCLKKRNLDADKKKRENAVPGLVEVGRYAYRSNIPDLEVGDVVLLPPSWVDELKGGKPQEGVVTCLYSDYDGPTKSILGLFRKGAKP
jgi:hypothetical protein